MSIRFILYLILVGLTFAMYSFHAMQELLFLLIILIALPLFSFLILLIARYFVRIRIITDKEELYRLEDFSLQIEVENRGPFYFPAVQIEFNLPLQAEYFVPSYMAAEDERSKKRFRRALNRKVFRFYRYPHLAYQHKISTLILPQFSSNTQEVILTPKHKGTYLLGSDSVVLQDLFGFFYLPLPKAGRRYKKTKESSTELTMHILPNPSQAKPPMTGELMAPEQVLMSKQNLKVSNEIDTLANVREYRPGDRVKQIHWKLSARLGEFLSREFEDPRQGGILFLLDPKLPDACHSPIDYVDQASEVMASSMRQMSRVEGPLTYIQADEYYRHPGEGSDPFNFYRALRAYMPQIKPGDPRLRDIFTVKSTQKTSTRAELSDILHKEVRREKYRAILVVTARMNAKLAQELYAAQKGGSQVLLVFLHNEIDKRLEEILSPLAHSKVRYFPVRINSLDAYQEEVVTPSESTGQNIEGVKQNVSPE